MTNMALAPVNSTITQPELVAVPTSSFPYAATAVVGLGLVGGSAAAFFLRRRTDTDTDSDVEKGDRMASIDADDSGKKKRKRNRQKKNRMSNLAQGGQLETDPAAAEAEQVESQSAASQSTSGETVNTPSTMPDGSETHSTSDTDRNDMNPFTSSGSAYAMPGHNTSIVIDDQPLRDIGLTSTPRSSTTDTASLFPAPPSGIVPSLSYIQHEVIISTYRSKCIESTTITRSPSKQAKFVEFMLEVNTFIKRCEMEVKQIDAERKQRIEEERQREIERKRRDSVFLRRERRK